MDFYTKLQRKSSILLKRFIFEKELKVDIATAWYVSSFEGRSMYK